MTTYSVGGCVGSVPTASVSTTPPKALIRLAPRNRTFSEIAIRDLPLHSDDGAVHDDSTAQLPREHLVALEVFIERALTARPHAE